MCLEPRRWDGARSRKESGLTLLTYTKDEAKAQFQPYTGTTMEGYPYTGYEYDGQKYHDVTYLGEFEDDKMPRNNNEYIDMKLNHENQ